MMRVSPHFNAVHHTKPFFRPFLKTKPNGLLRQKSRRCTSGTIWTCLQRSCRQRATTTNHTYAAYLQNAIGISHTVIFQRQYSVAIARQLPDTFADAISQDDSNVGPGTRVNMVRAKEQHKAYIEALRHLLPVLELPALSSRVSDKIDSDSNTNDEEESTKVDFPDCAFVEDTVVAVGQLGLVTRMGHPSRRGEGDRIYEILQQFGMDVLNMNDYYNSTDWIYKSGTTSGDLAMVDGGDVLYTGRHIYVGLSNRTNIEGAKFIKHYFSSYEVEIVPQLKSISNIDHPIPLHLKSAVTHIDSDNLLAPVGPYGDYLLDAMRATELGYTVHRIPDMLACNVVPCNGQVIVQNVSCLKSQQILHDAILDSGQDLIFVDTSELAKKDAALTCCSVLLEV
jgi:dimethylargininase